MLRVEAARDFFASKTALILISWFNLSAPPLTSQELHKVGVMYASLSSHPIPHSRQQALRAQGTEMRVYITSFTTHCWSHVFTHLHFIEKGTTKNFSCWSWSLMLTIADSAEAWLFLLGHATTVDSCLLSQHY